jgi:hypothetical protein
VIEPFVWPTTPETPEDPFAPTPTGNVGCVVVPTYDLKTGLTFER